MAHRPSLAERQRLVRNDDRIFAGQVDFLSAKVEPWTPKSSVVVLGLHILGIEIDVPVRRRAELEVERLVLDDVVVLDLAIVERLLHAALAAT